VEETSFIVGTSNRGSGHFAPSEAKGCIGQFVIFNPGPNIIARCAVIFSEKIIAAILIEFPLDARSRKVPCYVSMAGKEVVVAMCCRIEFDVTLRWANLPLLRLHVTIADGGTRKLKL
jgi:hypothetical protein